jgi:CRISPR-associated protein Csm1
MVLSHSQTAALQVAQAAVGALIEWAGSSLQSPQNSHNSAVDIATKTLNFDPHASKINALRLLFDDVKLPDGKESCEQHWCPIQEISDRDPHYPIPQSFNQKPDQAPYKNTVKTALEIIFQDKNNWKNLSLLSLILEKYGSCLSYGEENVSLVDIARITGAVAAALAQNSDLETLSFIAGDLSGIQDFIYTISSDGALKSLRARSFYLELVTEEIVQQLLDMLKLPRTSVIYAGGGNFYLLAPHQKENKSCLDHLQNTLNTWLLNEFQGKIFLALAYKDFQLNDVANKDFKEIWNKSIKAVNCQKNKKFINTLNEILEPKDTYTPCEVCHRDDTKDLQPIPNSHETDSSLGCPTCRDMFTLGDKLFRVQAIVRSLSVKSKHTRHCYPLKIFNTHYYLYNEISDAKYQSNDQDQVYLLNDWTLSNFLSPNTYSLLLGNYGQEVEDSGIQLYEKRFVRAHEMAEQSKGVNRVGYLRMDVDNLGQIFANGLVENQYSLPRLAGLSRQMSYFFKTYLNSLAQDKNLLFIYAGGDDLFIVGAWNEVTDFALDVYKAFRKYTGNHPDITLSAGISLAKIKYPLYQAANDSGAAESLAKGNGRDSLGLFGEVFKWAEWLGFEMQQCSSTDGNPLVATVEQRDTDYWNNKGSDHKNIPLMGILPFVERINQKQLQSNHSRNLVRNLLATAQIQEQKIKEIQKKHKAEEYDYQIQDFRYYLHLPQIAYALARLPKSQLDDEDFRNSLKSPYNAPYFRAIATWIELLTRNS